ncbi:hypothetical protein MGYG_06584 [Paecilomyces variotii No. 5]|uniref:Uncharacterized protein n=1 Tax=Byssochlamys spectabilis (strain No. 5 / NBRC 109023) TaxID=1356009 RepID=V5GBK5_BYSSN|nr:hypothetical protein MGYG_06584 [Paecilomyces variotii No. 5]
MAKSTIYHFLSLLAFLLFAVGIVPVSSSPTGIAPTPGLLIKRVPDPKIPTKEEARKHLRPLGPGKQVFYRMECKEAASHYARKIGGGLLGNADDGSRWANFDGGPFHERALREIDDKPTWNDDELEEAITAVSQAYAMNAEGDAVVILPYHIPKSHDIWEDEYEILKASEKVTRILAYDMKNPNAEPQGEPRELWPISQPRTEHAG